MARPGNNDMSRRRRQFEVMTKADFEWEAAQNGFTVEVVKNKREGWNEMVDHVTGVKDSWCAEQAQ